MRNEQEPQSPDKALWQSIQDGDEASFALFYKRYIKQIHQLVHRRIDDRAAVDDLVQDIFLTLWENKKTYHPNGPLFPYLRGMAINRVLHYYRTNKLKPQFVEIWDTLPEDLVDLQDLSLAFQQTQLHSMESLIEQAIATLPSKQREIYRLRFDENMPIPAIAKQTSTAQSTVYNQLQSIRQKFIDVLKSTSFYTFL